MHPQDLLTWRLLAATLLLGFTAAVAAATEGPVDYPQGERLQEEVFRIGRIDLILQDSARQDLKAGSSAQASAAVWRRKGESRLLGRGVPRDAGAAVREFARAASAGDLRARVLRASMVLAGLTGSHAEDDGPALDTLSEATRQGDMLAAAVLGQALVEGRALDRNLPEARHIWAQAAERDGTQAQWLLGRALITGLGGTAQEAEGWAWLGRAEASGSAVARDLRASWRATGMAPDMPAAAGLKALRDRAQAGDAHAQLVLGNTLSAGGPQLQADRAAGMAWLERAAGQGSGAACAAMARLWTSGTEPGADAKARAWALAGNQLGDLQAQELAGEFLLQGYGGPVEEDTAGVLLKGAANRGAAYAVTLLARRQLQGPQPDAVMARSYLRHAAHLGDPDGQQLLAQLLQSGQGGAQEPDAARAWMQHAARAGQREAIAWLAKHP